MIGFICGLHNERLWGVDIRSNNQTRTNGTTDGNHGDLTRLQTTVEIVRWVIIDVDDIVAMLVVNLRGILRVGLLLVGRGTRRVMVVGCDISGGHRGGWQLALTQLLDA